MNAGTWEHPLPAIKHFFTAPALRFPALVPMPGFGAFSRSVLDFESSAHVRNFVRDLSQRGQGSMDKIPKVR